MATPKIVLLSISSRRISKRPTCCKIRPLTDPSVFAFADTQATPDTLRPGGVRVAVPRVARQGCGLPRRSTRSQARLRLSDSAWQPSLASRAKAGAGGGTRTHTTLPSRDFKFVFRCYWLSPVDRQEALYFPALSYIL